MQITFLHGYPDYIGKRLAICGYGNGPASYLTAGDPVYFPRYDNYIDVLFPALSVDAVYQVQFQPSGYGARQTWNALWSFNSAGSVASVAQNAAGTGMTPGTYTVTASTGSAQISVVVASATTLGAITVLNPGSGYATAPTFTLTGTGGTPATLTATLSSIGGKVAAGANLSSEVVQIGGFGGVY